MLRFRVLETEYVHIWNIPLNNIKNIKLWIYYDLYFVKMYLIIHMVIKEMA